MARTPRRVADTRAQIKKRVAKEYPTERVLENEVEGPHNVGRYQMARVWTEETKGDHEYHAHHHVRDGAQAMVFWNFSEFAMWLGNEADFRSGILHDQRLEMIKTIVASILVLGSFGLAAYGFRKIVDPTRIVILLVNGVLLLAAGYLFPRRRGNVR